MIINSAAKYRKKSLMFLVNRFSFDKIVKQNAVFYKICLQAVGHVFKMKYLVLWSI